MSSLLNEALKSSVNIGVSTGGRTNQHLIRGSRRRVFRLTDAWRHTVHTDPIFCIRHCQTLGESGQSMLTRRDKSKQRPTSREAFQGRTLEVVYATIAV